MPCNRIDLVVGTPPFIMPQNVVHAMMYHTLYHDLTCDTWYSMSCTIHAASRLDSWCGTYSSWYNNSPHHKSSRDAACMVHDISYHVSWVKLWYGVSLCRDQYVPHHELTHDAGYYARLKLCLWLDTWAFIYGAGLIGDFPAGQPP
jgi:hypothetical protein